MTDEVALVPAPGHTPGHMMVSMESAEERALLVADAFLHPAQISEPDWVSMFDMDPGRERETRRRLLDELETGDVLFAASHFPDPAFGRVVRDGGRLSWEPMA